MRHPADIELSPNLTQDLKRQAASLGFVLTGVAAAASPERWPAFCEWLDSGYHGQMHYLADRKTAYEHPRSILEGCRSILMLALPYSSTPGRQVSDHDEDGLVARYAQAPLDYHDLIHDRLKQLKQWLNEAVPGARVRGVVDTAPLLEREFAEMAGLGWVAKNTLLINRNWGSYFFLAALLTDLELELDPPHPQGHCGTCTACLDSCPTQAFPKPFVLDANRCISYHTIENRGELPDDIRSQLNGWVFGCDICQEVCPWNRKERTCDPSLEPRSESIDLLELLELDEEGFRQRLRKTPFWRPRRRGMLRNAILIAGNRKLNAALPALRRLICDEEPLLRICAAWALLRIEGASARACLEVALEQESDPDCRKRLRELSQFAE